MKKFMLAGLAAVSCLAVLIAVAPAKALMIAPPPVPLRVATADLVVVGKVTGFGDKAVPAERFKDDTAQYQIAKVKVDETLFGKGVKEVKVAFVPPMPVAPAPGGGVRPFIRRGPQVNLTVGQEACLFLVKHPTKDFYTLNAYYDVLNKTDNPNFGTETGEVKRVARLLANPKAGLTSKDKEERFQTASLLITKYRTPRPYIEKPKMETVPAAESKLILEALADADWTMAPGRAGVFMMNPQAMFYRLNLTPADGWVQPKDFKEFPAEAKKWLKANAGKYRLQRYASPVKEEEPSPGE